MPAKASQEERILLHQLDSKVVNLPHMADACDESGKLADWLKETPRSSQPSRITAVKEQQCGECGRNVTSVSVGRTALDDRSRLRQSGDISVSVACGAKGAGEGNRPWGLGTAATVEP
jgi:hypothetical protein